MALSHPLFSEWLLRGLALSLAAVAAFSFLRPGDRARGILLAVTTAGFLLLPVLLCIGLRWTPGWIPLPKSSSPPTAIPVVDAFTSGGGWIIILWISGVAACLLRLSRGARVLAQFLPGKTSLPARGDLLLSARRAAAEIGIRMPQVCVSPSADHTPFATGLLRPTIVLPASASSWSPRALHSVLLHEMAHIRRGDLWMQAAGNAVCALYWFNPLVWFLHRQLAAEREFLADSLVVQSGTDPRHYAHSLLDIAARTLHPLSAQSSTALGLSGPSNLEIRILRLVNGHPPRRRLRLKIAAALAVSLTAVAASACLDPFAQAPEAPHKVHGDPESETIPPPWTDEEIEKRLSASPFPGE